MKETGATKLGLILTEVAKEREKQNEKWGEQKHLPIEWIAILTEEVGEAAKDALDHHYQNDVKVSHEQTTLATGQDQLARLKNYRNEVIQIAAVAVQMVECLDKQMYRKK